MSLLLNRVTSGSDLDYYLGQWVIRVSDADPVSTLFHIPIDAMKLRLLGVTIMFVHETIRIMNFMFLLHSFVIETC